MKIKQPVVILIALLITLVAVAVGLLSQFGVSAVIALLLAVVIKRLYPDFIMSTGTIWFSTLVIIQAFRGWRSRMIREFRNAPRLLLFGDPVGDVRTAGCCARGHLAVHHTLRELILCQKAEIVVVRYRDGKAPMFWRQYLWLLRHDLIVSVPKDAHVVIITNQKGHMLVDEEHTSFFWAAEVNSDCFANYCMRLKALPKSHEGPS